MLCSNGVGDKWKWWFHLGDDGDLFGDFGDDGDFDLGGDDDLVGDLGGDGDLVDDLDGDGDSGKCFMNNLADTSLNGRDCPKAPKIQT